jgi:hypothetical protein
VAVWAVTIEPFEVSLRRGGCGGLLWDFNQPGWLLQSRCGRLRAGGATVRCCRDWGRSVRCVVEGGGWALKLVKKTCGGMAWGTRMSQTIGM